jgi:hypothetical protein
VSGGELDTGRLLYGSDAGGVATGVGAAPPVIIDDTESGAPTLEGVAESVEALWPDSLEPAAMQAKIPRIESSLTVNAAIRLPTRHMADLTRSSSEGIYLSEEVFVSAHLKFGARIELPSVLDEDWRPGVQRHPANGLLRFEARWQCQWQCTRIGLL